MILKFISPSYLLSKAKEIGYFSSSLILLAIIIGTAVRFSNLFNLGYVFDTVTTQYEWGLKANQMGLVDFWKNYQGFFDYLPGALYIISGVEWVSRLFGGDPESFVVALKSLNWIADIGFIASLVYIGKRYGGFSSKALASFAAFTYLVPSIWFVSVVWGQFDTLLVLISIASVILLYRGVESKIVNKKFYKDPIFWSGVVFAIGFWFKLQTALLIPVLALFHLCYRNKSWFLKHLTGFAFGTVFLIAMPLLVNANRLGSNLVSPYQRKDVITMGAASFWRLVGMEGVGSDKLFDFNNGISLSVGLAGAVLYTFFIILLTVHYLKLDLRKLPKISKVFPNSLSFLDFSVIMMISSSMYYMLFTKMHSRYLHMGLLFGFVAYVATQAKYRTRSWLWLLLAINISYFLDQVYVFTVGGNTNPDWAIKFYSSFGLNLVNLSSLVNLLSIIGFYYLIWNSKKSIDNAGV